MGFGSIALSRINTITNKGGSTNADLSTFCNFSHPNLEALSQLMADNEKNMELARTG